MRLKGKLGIFVSICAVIGIALFGFMQKEPYSTKAVMDSVWDKYNVQSTMIGGESTDDTATPTLWVDVYDEDDIPQVENHLKKNLSQDDLEYYEIDVFLYESEKSLHKKSVRK